MHWLKEFKTANWQNQHAIAAIANNLGNFYRHSQSLLEIFTKYKQIVKQILNIQITFKKRPSYQNIEHLKKHSTSLTLSRHVRK